MYHASTCHDFGCDAESSVAGRGVSRFEGTGSGCDVVGSGGMPESSAPSQACSRRRLGRGGRRYKPDTPAGIAPWLMRPSRERHTGPLMRPSPGSTDSLPATIGGMEAAFAMLLSNLPHLSSGVIGLLGHDNRGRFCNGQAPPGLNAACADVVEVRASVVDVARRLARASFFISFFSCNNSSHCDDVGCRSGIFHSFGVGSLQLSELCSSWLGHAGRLISNSCL